MQALTISPGTAQSLRLDEIDAPPVPDGEVLVDGLLLGVCGTDRELADGEYGWAPPGRDRLIIGHESLGRVAQAPPGSGFEPGDLVAGVVRRPDPVPCGACAHGEFDFCRNGRYTERGIKELDGFGVQRWTSAPEYLVKLDPALGRAGVLMEPCSVVAKAWDQVDRIGGRAWFEPRTAVVCGAGPVGLLAALLGVQRGLDVHVLDVVTAGPKPGLVADLGATYQTAGLDTLLDEVRVDVVIETTGVPAVLAAALRNATPYALTCLLGMHDPEPPVALDLATVGRDAVLGNTVVVGSVNANVAHWRAAARALGEADCSWLLRLLNRTVPLSRAAEAFVPQPDDVKVVIDLQP